MVRSYSVTLVSMEWECTTNAKLVLMVNEIKEQLFSLVMVMVKYIGMINLSLIVLMKLASIILSLHFILDNKATT